MVRLSVVNYDTSGGATGGEDMDLTTLAWGERDATSWLLRYSSWITMRIGSSADDGFWLRANLMRSFSRNGNCWRPLPNSPYAKTTASHFGRGCRCFFQENRSSLNTLRPIRSRPSRGK